MPERKLTEDDVARSVLRMARSLRKSVPRMTGGTSGTGSGIGGGGSSGVVRRVLTALGDLLYGGEAGAERRLPIGTVGQILTVVDVGGDLLPRWQDAAVVLAGALVFGDGSPVVNNLGEQLFLT